MRPLSKRAILAFAVLPGLAAAALMHIAGSAPVAACDMDSLGFPGDTWGIDMRVDARWNAAGRIEVGVRRELITSDCGWKWSERWLPSRRFFPSDPPVGRWLNSSPISAFGAVVRVSARLRADDSTEFAFQQEAFGKWRARRSVGAFLPRRALEGEWRASPPLEFWFAAAPSHAGQPSFSLERDKAYSATLVMEDGAEIEIELFHLSAPLTVNLFIHLARTGYYDGRRFDLATKDGAYDDAEDPKVDDAAYVGRPFNSYPFIPVEYTGRPNVAGAVGMAPPLPPRQTGTPEFYIKAEDYEPVEGDSAWLKDPVFVFGRVVSGLDFVRAMPGIDPRKGQIGPRIEGVRISERPRAFRDAAPGVIPYGFRAGSTFDENRLGDPDAPVLVRRLVRSSYCPQCFGPEVPVEPRLIEELFATGIARYEVLPVPGRGPMPASVQALACSVGQGKFWQMLDLLNAVGLLRESSDYSLEDLARATWMSGAELRGFRACIDDGGYLERAASWQEQAEAIGHGASERVPEGGYSYVTWGVYPPPGGPRSSPGDAASIIERALQSRERLERLERAD